MRTCRDKDGIVHALVLANRRPLAIHSEWTFCELDDEAPEVFVARGCRVHVRPQMVTCLDCIAEMP